MFPGFDENAFDVTAEVSFQTSHLSLHPCYCLQVQAHALWWAPTAAIHCVPLLNFNGALTALLSGVMATQ